MKERIPQKQSAGEQKRLTPEEKWNSATIANNFIFYKIMRNNPDVCKELLEILLEMEIERIDIRTEETVEIDLESKGIRLDVLAKNAEQTFNLEMQSINTKELPERARYYQGAMDVDSLSAGQKYKELKDSYVIFICTHDIFEKGLACYSFENLCREDKSIRLNDRTLKYFFIASNCAKILKNEKQRAFLEFVIGRKASDDFTKRLASLTEEAKHNTEWKRKYMEWERQRTYDFEDGKEAGIAIGEAQKAVEAGKNFLAEGDSPEKVARCMGLPLEQVLELAERLKKDRLRRPPRSRQPL